MTVIHKYLNQSVLIVLLLWLFVDTVLGFSSYAYGNDSVKVLGVGFRLLSLCLFVSVILLYSNSAFLERALTFLSVYFLLMYIHIVFIGEEEALKVFQGGVKVLLPLVSFYCFDLLTKIGFLTEDRFKKIILFNLVVLIFNLLLFYFGYGISNYGYSETGEMKGGRGYFYAGNEVAGLSIALFSLGLFLCHQNKKLSVSFIIVIGVCVAGLMSKAAIISYFVISSLFLFLASKKLFISAVIVFIFLALLHWDKLVDSFNVISMMIERWGYFISQYGLETVLLGGEKRLIHISEQFSDLSSVWYGFLLGFGWSGEAENNLLDLIYGYGFLGGLIYIFWALAPIQHFRKSLKANAMKKNVLRVATMTLFMLFLVGSFAGHIVQSAMLSVFWGLLLVSPRFAKT